jgi:hypothetical protein
MILTGFLMVPTSAAFDRVKVGTPIPVPAFPSTEGKRFQLKELMGRKAVLHIFASW